MSRQRKSRWSAPPGSLEPRNLALGAAIPIVLLALMALIYALVT